MVVTRPGSLVTKPWNAVGVWFGGYLNVWEAARGSEARTRRKCWGRLIAGVGSVRTDMMGGLVMWKVEEIGCREIGERKKKRRSGARLAKDWTHARSPTPCSILHLGGVNPEARSRNNTRGYCTAGERY